MNNDRYVPSHEGDRLYTVYDRDTDRPVDHVEMPLVMVWAVCRDLNTGVLRVDRRGKVVKVGC